MEKLVGHIRTEAGDPKLLLCTPSPFDQTVVLRKQNNQPGCNDGLAGARRSFVAWPQTIAPRSSISTSP